MLPTPDIPRLICFGLVLLGFFIISQLITIVYRLLWHPLSGFPGPKLAAVTDYYQAWFERNGRLSKHVAKLHDTYGQVVRLAPNEVHIKDLNSYYNIYTVGTDFHKEARTYGGLAIDGSLLNILSTKDAKRRRDAYSHRFSSRAILENEDLILGKLDKLIAIMKGAGELERAVNMSLALKCFLADVIMQHAFQQDFGALNSQEFSNPVVSSMDDLFVSSQWGLHFPRFAQLLELMIERFPRSIVRQICPRLLDFNDYAKDVSGQVRSARESYKAGSSGKTILDLVLSSSAKKGLPFPEDSVLVSEMLLMLLAGTDTTANALVVGVYSALSYPNVLQELKAELKEVLEPLQPTQRKAFLKYENLQKLTYLSAFIKEALRVSSGAPGRLPRIVPPSGHMAADQYIPPGTVIAHSHYVYQSDAKVFPEPEVFRPERWLEGVTAEMERSHIPFSKGSRACLGIHLATVQLYVTFAKIFSELEMDLWQTTAEDMKWGDYTVPIFNGCLRVMVKGSNPLSLE